MTTEQKIIRAKVGLLELAKQLGNVSQACKMMGYSRDSLYRWTDGFAEGSVGARPCGNWNIFLAGSGHWGPIAIQPKGDSKCHRCVCG